MKGSVHYGLSHISQSGFGIDCGVKDSEEYSVKCSVQYSENLVYSTVYCIWFSKEHSVVLGIV